MIKEKLTITGQLEFLNWLDKHISNELDHYILTDLKTKQKKLIIIFKLDNDYLAAKRAIYTLISGYKDLHKQNINVKLDLLVGI